MMKQIIMKLIKNKMIQIEFILDEGGIICSKNVQSSKVSLIEG